MFCLPQRIKLLYPKLPAIFNHHEISFHYASNGSLALNIINQEPEISLMVIDSDLPGINGYEVVREVRESGRKDIVIILLAWFCLPSMKMANELGANELIAKPAHYKELSSIISKWTGISVNNIVN